MKKLFSILFLLPLFLFLPSTSWASNHFLITTQANYDVNENGTTHVTLSETLESTTGDVYAASYTLSAGLTNIDNLTVSDGSEQIIPEVKKDGDVQYITIPFGKKKVGLDKNMFTVSFDSPDIASHMGNIWEVTIPGVDQSEFQVFNVHINVPPSFGTPAYIKPQINTHTLDFTKDQIGKSGISIGFGKQQSYQFFLTYHLQNKNLIPITTELALPPTTNYQTVATTKILPKPLTITKDREGNWMARYYLLPFQTISVTAEGIVDTHIRPDSQTLVPQDRRLYLQTQPYWQVSDEKIQTLSQSLKTPEAIYTYVVSHLSYDYSRVTAHQLRLGASNALKNPSSAVCLEFTDLFISLARAAGIPAREVDGYAYTQNSKLHPLSLVKDVLHAWPEYYDDTSKQWIMVDPTWANTTQGLDYFHTLDFDHVAFAIKGEHSEYPIPAGGYKLTGDENLKDVQVVFAPTHKQFTPHFTLTVNPTSNIYTNSAVQGVIHIENNGPVALPDSQVIISDPELTPKRQIITGADILPFSSIDLPFHFSAPSLTKTQTSLTIQVGKLVFVKTIPFYSILSNKIIVIGGGLLGTALIIIISVIAVRTRHLSVP